MKELSHGCPLKSKVPDKKIYDITPIVNPDNYQVYIQHFQSNSQVIELLKCTAETCMIFQQGQKHGDYSITYMGQAMHFLGDWSSKLDMVSRSIQQLVEGRACFECMIKNHV